MQLAIVFLFYWWRLIALHHIHTYTMIIMTMMGMKHVHCIQSRLSRDCIFAGWFSSNNNANTCNHIISELQQQHLIGYSIHHVSFAPLFIDVKTLLGSVYFVIFLNHRIIAYFKEVIKMKIAFRLVLNSISISISSLLHIFTGWNRVRLNCFLSDELKWLKDVRP